MIVIADDITGAAEVAGIAYAHGQKVHFVCNIPDSIENDGYDLLVVATDTRSMTEKEATIETLRIIKHINSWDDKPLFKKTDSALRGHVVAELSALLEHTGYQRVVYLPANPSKGRIIDHGIYYIEQKDGGKLLRRRPLHETDFSYDPEFPAKTSVLREHFPDAQRQHIVMPDATTLEEIRHIVNQYDESKTLFAGAADLFKAVAGYNSAAPPQHVCHLALDFPILVVCGSTQSRPLDIGITVAAMPLEIYDGANSEEWYVFLQRQYTNDKRHSLILTIPPHRYNHDKETALRLRHTMAEAVRRLCQCHLPRHLVIEGGATAWATLQALGWEQFDIVGNVAPGVVQMRAMCGTIVTLKPGSYDWGGLFGE